MIEENIIVKFKSASLKKKQMIKKILMDNYESLIDEMVSDADYGCTTSYWKDNIPLGDDKIIMSAEEFITTFDKKKKTK